MEVMGVTLQWPGIGSIARGAAPGVLLWMAFELSPWGTGSPLFSGMMLVFIVYACTSYLLGINVRYGGWRHIAVNALGYTLVVGIYIAVAAMGRWAGWW